MSSTGRRKNASVTAQLTQSPHEFQFFQAVRLLEQAAFSRSNGDGSFGREPVALSSPPNREAIRFRTHQALSFPSAEITKIGERDGKAEKQWEMVIAFMGLTGPSGVLPYHYSELILQRLKLKDHSLAHFLDLFNHRTISLFYNAGTKYRFPFDYERHRRNDHKRDKHDGFSHALLSLIGLGTSHLSDRLHTQDESLLYYGGLLSNRVRSSSALKRMLEHHFELPITINEFKGEWHELIPDVRTMLPSKEHPKGRNNCLGSNCVIGERGWFAQGRFQVAIGPLNQEQFDSLAPGTQRLQAIDEMTRLYAGMEMDFDIVVYLRKSYIPEQVSLRRDNPPILGWNSWIAAQDAGHYQDEETVAITVSSHTLTNAINH